MPFPKRLLIPNEELILDLRPHPVALALPVLVVLAELAVAIYLTLTFDFNSLIWWALVVVIFVLYPMRRLIWWLTSNFAVTTDRVIHREGFIAKRSMEIPLEAINDVRFDQGIWDRIVGAGTLRISSALSGATATKPFTSCCISRGIIWSNCLATPATCIIALAAATCGESGACARTAIAASNTEASRTEARTSAR